MSESSVSLRRVGADDRERRQPPGAIEIRVLGPVEIAGASRPFTRAWSLELAVFLAFHRRGASTDQWAEALWPDRVVAAATLHSTASAARRALGATADGDDHLPRGHGRLQLARTVSSDWDRLRGLSESGDPRDWYSALGLIRGRPFDGLRGSDWVVLEGVQAAMEGCVVELACRHAGHCLEVGDPPAAQWAARQGLRVSPYDERLYRVLLRAADAAGNPAGVESVMSELVRHIGAGAEPREVVHPSTFALYQELSRHGVRRPA